MHQQQIKVSPPQQVLLKQSKYRAYCTVNHVFKKRHSSEQWSQSVELDHPNRVYFVNILLSYAVTFLFPYKSMTTYKVSSYEFVLLIRFSSREYT